MFYKDGRDDHHAATYDVSHVHRVYHGFYNLQLFEECYLVGGAYRADLVGVRRGAKLDKEDIFGCDEEIFVAEVKPPEEYVTYDDVQKLGEAATIAKRELAEKRSLTVTGEDGEQHRVSINVKDKSRVQGFHLNKWQKECIILMVHFSGWDCVLSVSGSWKGNPPSFSGCLAEVCPRRLFACLTDR